MVSKRAEIYGRAFFDILSDEETLNLLKSFSMHLKEEPYKEFFNSSVVSLKNKKEVLQKVLPDQNPHLLNFFKLLLDKKTFSLLGEITLAYENLLNEKHSRIQGVVYSSETLSKDQVQNVEEAIGKILKKKARLQARKAQSVVAGLYVKIGGYIFNDTLINQFKKFQSLGG
ncbi:MAG: ATP synthase F1 subunit delta [Bdellovibrionales bacterium]